MKNLKQPKLVTIAIMTTITVIFWVFFSVYSILTTKVPPSVSEDILAPLNPVLDNSLLNSLSERIYFKDSEIVSPVFENTNDIEKSPEDAQIVLTEEEPIENDTDTAEPTNTPEEQ